MLKKNALLMALTCIIFFMTVTPLMKNIFSPVYFIAMWGVFSIYYFFCIPSSSKKIKTLFKYGVIYLFLIFSYRFLGCSSAEWGNYLNQIRFFMPLLLLIALLEKSDYMQLNYTFHAMLFIVALNILDGIRLSILYPMSSYQLMNEELSDEGLILNLGGSSFVTLSMFFLNIVFYNFLNTASKKMKILYLIYSLIALYFLAFCSFKASTLVLGLFSLILQLVSTKTSDPKKFLIFASVVGVLGYCLIEPVIHFLVYLINSDRMTERLLFFTGESDGASVGARENLYMLSIETWLEGPANFVFGIGDHRASHGAKFTGIGQHSDFLDTFARYGLFGAFIVFTFFYNLYKFLLSMVDKRQKLTISLIFFIIVLCGLMKKVFFPDCGIIILLLFPLSLKINQLSKEQQSF